MSQTNEEAGAQQIDSVRKGVPQGPTDRMEIKISKEQLDSLRSTFGTLGMQNEYSDRHLYEALRQSKGDKDLAVEMVLNG